MPPLFLFYGGRLFVCRSLKGMERLHATFGHLTGVGLDRPGPVKSNMT
ncbi:MAG: hypothetical protein QOE49_3998 [Rhodospirillaceae bacterium]|jgi:hypothetical protein|nr:hypothetical protein [Rhodospirillaceae bacterium]